MKVLITALITFLVTTSCTTSKIESTPQTPSQQYFITKEGQHVFVLSQQPIDPTKIRVLISNEPLTPDEYHIDCDKLSKGCHAEIGQSWKYDKQDNVIRFNYRFPKNKLVIIKYK